MKRTIFVILAAFLAAFALLVALDAVNFETDRIDRWVMIFSFGGVAVLVGLASADPTSDDAEPTSARTLAAQRTAQSRPAPSDLPSKPGSLHRKAPIEVGDETVLDLVAMEQQALEVPQLDDDELDVDAIDAELHEMIDEDQVDEITALVGGTLDTGHLGESTPEPEEYQPTNAIDTTDGARAQVSVEGEPLARLDLRLADYDDAALARVVKESEAVVIKEMIRTGQLTTEGALTDRDVASMVFLAYTSEEMLAELRLRKAMDQPGDVPVTGRDLAPLRNIE